jgi:hypothetical protein
MAPWDPAFQQHQQEDTHEAVVAVLKAIQAETMPHVHRLAAGLGPDQAVPNCATVEQLAIIEATLPVARSFAWQVRPSTA